MNSRQLKYIITLSERQSFSEAADVLMISQPSLSQFVQKLEDELGVALFERTNPLKITAAGDLYVNMAKKMLSDEAEFYERLDDLTGTLSGVLRIGTGYLNSISTLPELIMRYQQKFPNVQIEIIEDTEPELKGIADDGKLDLVMATSNFATAKYERVVLYEEAFLMAVPKAKDNNHQSNNKEIKMIEMKNLSDIPVIRLQENTFIRELLDSLYEISYKRPKGTIECTTATASYAMAKLGIGACMIPYSMYKSDYCEDLNYYSIKELADKRQISLYYNRGRCIIIGKAANYILRSLVNVIKINIQAPEEKCIKNVMQRLQFNYEEARKTIQQTDKYRADYYKYYTGKEWLDPKEYHLSINTGTVTEEYAAQLIIKLLKDKKLISE